MKKSDKEIIKDLRSEIRFLEREIIRYKEIYIKEDRAREYLERWIKSKFEWWILLLSEGKSPCLKYLIKDTAHVLGMKA